MADLFANPNALPSRRRSSAPAPRRTPPPPPRRSSAPSRSEGPPSFSGEDGGERGHPKYIGFTEADDPWIPRTAQPTSQVPAGTGRFLARDPKAGYTSLQRPLYTTEHISDIYGMPPQAIADLQDHLVSTGILTGKYRRGIIDDKTRTAYTNLLEMANRNALANHKLSGTDTRMLEFYDDPTIRQYLMSDPNFRTLVESMAAVEFGPEFDEADMQQAFLTATNPGKLPALRRVLDANGWKGGLRGGDRGSVPGAVLVNDEEETLKAARIARMNSGLKALRFSGRFSVIVARGGSSSSRSNS